MKVNWRKLENEQRKMLNLLRNELEIHPGLHLKIELVKNLQGHLYLELEDKALSSHSVSIYWDENGYQVNRQYMTYSDVVPEVIRQYR